MPDGYQSPTDPSQAGGTALARHGIGITRIVIEIDLRPLRLIDMTVVATPIQQIAVQVEGEARQADVTDQSRLRGLVVTEATTLSFVAGRLTIPSSMAEFRGYLTQVDYGAVADVVSRALAAIQVTPEGA